MTNSIPTQAARVVKYIEDFGSITTLEAVNDLGILRLASRVSELRKKGFNIKSEFIEVKNRYGETCRVKRYSMEAGEHG